MKTRRSSTVAAAHPAATAVGRTRHGGPALKPVPPLTVPVPPEARERVERLRDAIADREQFAALLLRCVSSGMDKATRRLVATLAGGETLRAEVTCPVTAAVGAAIVRSLGPATRHPGATVFVRLQPAPLRGNRAARPGRPAPADFLEDVAAAVRPLREARADVKIVLATPHLRVSDPVAVPAIEVRSVRNLGWNLREESQRLRVAARLAEAGLTVPLGRAVTLLDGLERHEMVAACAYTATLRGRRQQGHKPAPGRGPGAPDGNAAGATDAADAADLADACSMLQRDREPATDPAVARAEARVACHLLPPLPPTQLVADFVGPPWELRSFVRALAAPERLHCVVPCPRPMLLLSGPPGTGKTHAVRLIAAELGLPVLAPKSSELMSCFVGRGARNLYDLFAGARLLAAARQTRVILFFDELDALFSRRSRDDGRGSDEYARVVNAFLESTEGIDPAANGGIVVIGATNLPGALDPAVDSRFGAMRVALGLPDRSARAELITRALAGRRHDLDAAAIVRLADAHAAMSGRDIRNAVDRAGMAAFAAAPAAATISAAQMEAALRAVRRQADTTWAEKFLLPTRRVASLDEVLVRPPAAVEQLVARIRDAPRMAALVPQPVQTCLVAGPAGVGKTTLARGIGAVLGLPVFAPSAAELAGPYVAEAGLPLARLLGEAAQYARARQTRAVVCLDALETLAAAGSEVGEVPATLWSWLEALGRLDADAHRHLVIVAALRTAHEVPAELREHFEVAVTLALPQGPMLAEVLDFHLRGRPQITSAAGRTAALAAAHGLSGRDLRMAVDAAGLAALWGMRAPGTPLAIDDANLCAGVQSVLRRRAALSPAAASMYT